MILAKALQQRGVNALSVDTRKYAREAWTKTDEIVGGGERHDDTDIDGITAQVLNDHYAAVSTDRD